MKIPVLKVEDLAGLRGTPAWWAARNAEREALAVEFARLAPAERAELAGRIGGWTARLDAAHGLSTRSRGLVAELADVLGATSVEGTGAVTNAPHVMVTWANAITTGQRTTECFQSRELALAAAGDRSREEWNNTRVTVCWHEAHARAGARRARCAARRADHVHVWGGACAECAALSADRAESAALVEAARDAAGDAGLMAVTS